MLCDHDHGQGLLEPNHNLQVPKRPSKPQVFLYNTQSTDRMYRKGIAILSREAVVYLDSSSICANGELLDTKLILRRRRDATPQEDDDRAVSFGPGGMADAVKASAGPDVHIEYDRLACRNSICLPMPILTLTRVSSSMVLMIGILLEW